MFLRTKLVAYTTTCLFIGLNESIQYLLQVAVETGGQTTFGKLKQTNVSTFTTCSIDKDIQRSKNSLILKTVF